MVDEKQEPPGFLAPSQLPRSREESRAWQEANRQWWEQHPMRYDWRLAINSRELTRDFYEEIDRRWVEAGFVNGSTSSHAVVKLMDLPSLSDKSVLEIGVGLGGHAALLAGHARRFVGIDLTAYAVSRASRRFEIFGLKGGIVQMDAESMAFDDESFDFIWSWGVIHHSADTSAVLAEMRRVLRPGGRAVVMVYHKGFWNYIITGIIAGIARGHLLRGRSLHSTVQARTDGALARYYSVREWRRLASRYFDVERVSVYGQKADLLPLPAGVVKRTVESLLPHAVCRGLLSGCRMGMFVVATLRKPS